MSGLAATTASGPKRSAPPGSYRELLIVAVPLMLATGSHSIQFFVDRLMLSRYSQEAVAAASPAGMAVWTVMAFFMGTVGYVSTFVSQYYGAGQLDRVGRAIWQGLYLSVVSYFLILPSVFFAEDLFRWAGHPVEVQPLEAVYFRILILGALPSFVCSALSGFFGGLGRTVVVMLVTVAVTACNIVLDYAMIFGRFGFAAMGISGAAYATVLASVLGLVIYAVLFLARANRSTFDTVRGAAPDLALVRRLLVFGVPYGLHSLIDAASWAFWVMILGGLGTLALAASNIVFSINMLALMPAVGIGVATQILVGQHLGANRDDYAAQTTRRAAILSLLVMLSIALLYVYAPRPLLGLFRGRSAGEAYSRMENLGVTLLAFVAVYSIGDAITIVYSSALRGAGDTRFIMYTFLVLSWAALGLPTFLAVKVFHGGLYAVWGVATVYCIIASIVFYLRYRHGRWRTLRVIEPSPVETPVV
ncbi:MAG: MATE family efflux transporter [Planctomycetota bacterium]